MARTELQAITSETFLTSHEAAGMIQHNPSSINKWVKEGRIACHTTPGGHRRIKAADFVSFLEVHQMPIPQKLQPCAAAAVAPPKKTKKKTATKKR